jgi:hypothetical protein
MVQNLTAGLPVFPRFKHISRNDTLHVKSLTCHYPPYSDYDFVSLWIWDTNNSVLLSTLHDNLVVQFSDYLSGEQFLSFCGTNRVEETVRTLLSHAKKKGLVTELRLIPEVVVSHIRTGTMNNLFRIIEDENNRDYLLDTDKISKMSGKKLHQKRKLLHHFIKKHAYTAHIRPLTAETVRKELLRFFFQWEKERDKTRTETRNELTAFRRLLRARRNFSVEVLTISVDGSICGFTIFEHVRPDYAVSAFQKGSVSEKGIYEVLNW